MRSKNFSFVESMNNDMYSRLCGIEHDAYLKPLDASRGCRYLFESILKKMLNEKGIESPTDVGKMLKLVRKNNLPLPSKNKLPKRNVKCYLSNQAISVEQLDAYTFLKNIGNAASHYKPYPENDDNKNPIPNTENVLYALELFHILIQRIYQGKTDEDLVKFKEKEVPIGDFFIEEIMPGIADKARTNCVREYKVYRYKEGSFDRKKYGLIREYDVSGMTDSNKHAFARMQDVYAVLEDQMQIEGVTFRSLNEPSEEYANYFVAYEFRDDVKPLRSLLDDHNLSVQDKLQLCFDIAKQLESFHASQDHVYLRLLTYDNIMVKTGIEKSSKKNDPIIIKYEFPKIISSNPEENGLTILELVKSVSNNNELGLNTRIARYCINEDFDEGTDWEKVDVGSLGVLFADICYGEITRTNPYELIDELKDNHSVPECMVDLLTIMTDPVNICRPTLKEVIERMTEIIADI